MNNRQRATLVAIFAKPTPATIRWADIESLIVALGGTVTESEGSRVRLALNGVRATLHSPHPRPTTGRLTVRDVRRFLEQAGVAP